MLVGTSGLKNAKRQKINNAGKLDFYGFRVRSLHVSISLSFKYFILYRLDDLVLAKCQDHVVLHVLLLLFTNIFCPHFARDVCFVISTEAMFIPKHKSVAIQVAIIVQASNQFWTKFLDRQRAEKGRNILHD